jgi:ATP-binding cassette subfamily B protein
MPHPADRAVPPGTARRVIGLARPRRRTIVLFGAVAGFGGLTAMLTPLALGTLVDDGIGGGRSEVVLRMALAAGELAAADALLSLVRRWLATRVGEDLALDLRSQAFAHVQHQPLARLADGDAVPLGEPAGSSAWRMLDEDIDRLRRAVTDLLAGVAGNAVIAAFVLGAMATISWPLTLAVLALLALSVRPARAIGRRAATRRRERAREVAAIEAVTAERFAPAGSVLSLLYGDPDREADAFEVRAAQLRDLGVRVALGDGTMAIALPLLTATATAVVYGAGGLLVINGRLALGGLVAVAACLGRLHRAIAAVARAPHRSATLLEAGARVFAALDVEPLTPERPGAIGLWRGPTAVSFEHVEVARPGVSPLTAAFRGEHAAPGRALGPVVLHDVSFRIDAGQLVAVVGPAGAGAAALSALVPRLLDVTAGAVRLGGVDVRDVAIESLRAKVGMVPAEGYLLHDTLGANLRIARPGADEDELLDALDQVELAALVPVLDRGLDTVVTAAGPGEPLGPQDAGLGVRATQAGLGVRATQAGLGVRATQAGRAHRLSAGERQRLALARILLQAPDVVVVDEPAAPLDPASERAGQRALVAALTGRTALVVAHRLATLRRADRIVVVSGGRIIEQGTHLELLALDRVYTQLYHHELADHDEGAAPRRPERPWEREQVVLS